MKTYAPYIAIAALIGFIILVNVWDHSNREEQIHNLREQHRKEIELHQAEEKARESVLLGQVESFREMRRIDSVKYTTRLSASNAEIRYWKKRAIGPDLSKAGVKELDSLKDLILRK